jgi:pseudaminic acid cytidylyltransferase
MKKSIICIIPARKGSKRIKNKNTINFLGKPLISYSIKTAFRSKLFDNVIVSTDCKNISKISKKFNASVPFLRKKKYSGDFISIKKVLKNTILDLETQNVEYHCLLYATAPMILKSDLISAFKKLKRKKDANGIISISKYSSNPMRSLYIENKYLKFRYPNYKYKNSNKLKDIYFDTGGFFIVRTKNFLKSEDSFWKKMMPFPIPDYRSLDINNLDDLKLAQILFKNLAKKREI